MQKWLTSGVILVLLLPVVVRAQRGRGAPPPRGVAGHGVLVPGWWARLDDKSQRTQALSFEPTTAGFHVKTGPASIFWDPQQTVSGDYTVKATFMLDRMPQFEEGYGLFIGGTNLDKDTERYTAFMVREDGRYLVRVRDGAVMKNLTGDWMYEPAITRFDAKKTLSNALAIRADKDTVTFTVNGHDIVTRPRAELPAVGVVGLRFNRGLELRVEGLAVEKPSKG